MRQREQHAMVQLALIGARYLEHSTRDDDPLRLPLEKSSGKAAVRSRPDDAAMGRSSSSRRRALEQCARIGSEVKLARVTHAMTGREVARRAGVAWSTQARVELGDPGVAITTLCAVAEAVGIDVVLRAYPGRGPTLRDTGQLALAEQICAQAHAGWQPNVELAVGPHGEAVDVALFATREIWALEIERMAIDFQAMYRRADGKRTILAALHQRPVRLVMVVEDSRRNRVALEGHLAFIRTTLPAGSREVLTALRTGRPLGRDGLAWVRRGAAGRPSR